MFSLSLVFPVREFDIKYISHFKSPSLMADLCVVKNIELTVELSIKQACDDPACDVFKTE